MGGLGNKRQRRRMDQKTVGYEIGYGRPPAANRFVPGQSGNPRGRPKGAVRNPSERLTQVWESAIDELLRPVPVRQGEIVTKMSAFSAVLRALMIAASKGDPRAAAQLSSLLVNLLKIGVTLPDPRLADTELKVTWVTEGARPEVKQGDE
jgi:hypothetical protein